MADKTVDFNNTNINASTIQDFYQRLNALGTLDHGEGDPVHWSVPYSYPQRGEAPLHDTIAEAYQAVMSTKSALSFLSSVDISTYTPTIPAANDSILKSNVAAIEWQIGQLENACYTNFTTNRATVKTANFSGNSIQSSSCSSAFYTSYGSFSSYFSSNYNGFFSSYNSSFFTFSGNNGSNFTTYYGSSWFTSYKHFSGYHTSVNTNSNSSFNSGFFSNYFGSYKSSFTGNSSFRGSNDTSNRTSFFNFTSYFNSNNGSSYFSSYRGSYHTGYKGTFNSAENSSYFNARKTVNFTTDFSNYAATFFANHGTFTVIPL